MKIAVAQQAFIDAFKSVQNSPESLSQELTVLIEKSGGDVHYLMWKICYLLRHLRLNEDNEATAESLSFFMIYLYKYQNIAPRACHYFGKTGTQLLIKGAEEYGGLFRINERTPIQKKIMDLYAYVEPEIGINYDNKELVFHMSWALGLMLGGLVIVVSPLLLPIPVTAIAFTILAAKPL